MEPSNPLDAICVVLLVGGERSLFVLLAKDGTINRMGNGSPNIDRQMFIGKATPGMFSELCSQITPGVSHFLGQRLVAPRPKGKPCELTIIFKYVDGHEAGSLWGYGAESQGPHPDIRDFVAATVRVTDPWFAQQKRLVRQNAKRA